MSEVNFDEMSTEELSELISFEAFHLSTMQIKLVTNDEGIVSIIDKMIERLKKIQSLYIELESRKKLFVC